MTSMYSNAAGWLGDMNGAPAVATFPVAFEVEAGHSRSINELETVQIHMNSKNQGKDRPRSQARHPNGHTWNVQQPKPKFVAHKTPKNSQSKARKEWDSKQCSQETIRCTSSHHMLTLDLHINPSPLHIRTWN
jgi:hypothetical protein